jgi:hypothetical protein
MYVYENEKPFVFTDEGQRNLLKMRDFAFSICVQAGAVRADKMMSLVSGDSWKNMACIDRLVELGDIVEVSSQPTVWQHRVFVLRRGD